MTAKRAERLFGVLARGEIAFGTTLQMSDPALLEIVALAGYDWVTIPLEHSTLSLADVESLQRAADARGITTLVVLASPGDDRALPLLNAGVGGIIAPMVERAAEVEELVHRNRFAPLGERGTHGGVRNADYGSGSYLDYIAGVDGTTAIAVIVETVAAVENIDEILAVEGLDVAFLGSADLAQALGVPGEFTHPKLEAAIRRVAAAATAAGVPLAMSEYGYTAAELKQLGARMIVAPGSEYGFLFEAYRSHLLWVREAVE